MTNEVTVINEWGEAYTIDMLRDKKVVENMSADALHDLAYAIKALKTPIKNVEDAVKKKLDDGVEIKGISYTEASKQMLSSDDEALKKAFVKKYGWDAVQVKTPAQLKKRFGTDIQEDLDKVVVYETQNRVKYD
ncbi:prophage pi3 protein 50 [Leuconostoc kimchii IMSNU 11154]|uniref:Prophage pi3 protein 50 n=1 Tax=Leuconostoc kimchii (strain IMSNU 11154 / KCTC 2386 / IH25) TaxID=762051 RepID=D5T4I4_LEUKI|nr:hypothetical protein [Leuconostoc kimchii]ADG41455.1 prophage pi3 protein 50 [Leuconostoc kimchii IMSNU 11154]